MSFEIASAAVLFWAPPVALSLYILFFRNQGALAFPSLDQVQQSLRAAISIYLVGLCP
jgi:hypothetical protein